MGHWKSTRSSKLVDQSGQSLIEFLVSFTFVIGFIFLFVKFAITVSNGFLVHYGTFQAARTFQSFENGAADPVGVDQAAVALANQQFEQLEIQDFVGRETIDLDFNLPATTGKYIYVGAKANFSQDLGVFKFLGGGSNLDLTSTAFLGKEPVKADCVRRICQAMSTLGVDCSTNYQTLFDNGC